VTDTALREQLRRRARATFEARFSAQALTTALRDIYAELGFTAAPERSSTEYRVPSPECES
jgi:hypothetical protein